MSPAQKLRKVGAIGFWVCLLVTVCAFHMSMSFAGLRGPHRAARALAQAKSLEIACKIYHDYMQVFPPQSCDSDGSGLLKKCLTEPFMVGGHNVEPLLELHPSRLDGASYPVDVWENRFQYRCPGTEHSNGQSPGKDNRQAFDLWSWGPNGPGSPPNEWITNWGESASVDSEVDRPRIELCVCIGIAVSAFIGCQLFMVMWFKGYKLTQKVPPST